MTITQAWAGFITKSERTPEGHLMVFGKATGPDLDLDGQICDPKWLKTAMPEWMKWANLREMHGPVAAGVGKELSASGDDWNLKALVVDRNAAEKVEAGVYKGFSIGIKNPQLVKDARAPGGMIIGGRVVEVSLVDRPCNPDATMGIAKAHGAQLGPVEAAGEVVGKAADDDASVLPDDGDDVGSADDPEDRETRPDEPDPDDVLLADAAAKAAKDDDLPIFGSLAKGATVARVEPPKPGQVGEALIPREATLTPTAYRKATATVTAVLAGTLVKRKVDESADIAGAQAVIAQLAQLIISEATELAAGRMDEEGDISCLMDAVRAVKYFMQREQRQDGTEVDDAPAPAGSMAYAMMAAEPDAGKRDFSAAERDDAAGSGAAMSDGRYPIKTAEDLKNAIRLAGHGKGSQAAIRAHIRRRAEALGESAMIPDDWSEKAAAPDGGPAPVGPDITKAISDAVAEATKDSRERIKALEADLVKVRALPIPGGPMLMPVQATRAASPADDRAGRAAEYAAQAKAATDPGVAHAYRSLAAREIEAK